MNTIKIDISKTAGFIPEGAVEGLKDEVFEQQQKLHDKSGAGNDFLGWVNLPSSITSNELTEIKTVANNIRAKADFVVVVGIGGSYLGTRAVIDEIGRASCRERV